MKKWKRLLAGILAIAMMLSCAPGMPLEVHAEENGEYTYTVNEDGNSVTITKYTGRSLHTPPCGTGRTCSCC